MKDYLELYVKKTKAQHLVDQYRLFGWTLERSRENAHYEDLVDLTFSREHNIPHKDDLQLLQVYMEERINATAKKEHNKHALSTSLGLCLGVLGLAMIVLGILILTQILPYKLAAAVVLLGLGSASVVLTAIFIPKIVKKENRSFKAFYDKNMIKIAQINDTVKSLLGGNNG